MAKPTDPQELTIIKAQDAYNAAAAAIEELLDDVPNPTWDSSRMDTWLINAITHWSTSPLAAPSNPMTPLPPVMKTQATGPKTPKCTPPPCNQTIGSSVPHLNLLTANPNAPALSYSSTPAPAKTNPVNQLPVMSQPQAPSTTMTRTQVALPLVDKAPGDQQSSTQKKVTPKPSTARTSALFQVASSNLGWGSPAWTSPSLTDFSPLSPPGFDVSFPPDLTSALHQKPNAFKFGLPTHATQSEVSSKLSSSHPLAIDTATCSSVIPGPNPVQEVSIGLPLGGHRPLFFPGTDEEKEQICGDLVEDSHFREEIASTNVNPSTTYLKATQGSKADAPKKKKKDVKRKDKAPEVAVPHKRALDDDNSAPTVERPATKKLKLKDTKITNDKVVHAMPAIRKCGPRPSKPPAVTLGIGGGGFGEKVPLSAKAIENGLKSIGVLEVEEDFGEFVKVDETLNTVEGALDTLAQHTDYIEDILINYMASDEPPGSVCSEFTDFTC
ncbi:hypothetical protein ARMGADRAFT_1087698 [Armillaria gallica]|uniref:Uncharacterized protein n=1 Tax=Armillaria gallica TaxID=47427 RepID=A0A2H3DAE3_ARMGA|nr:hypothetical protein ARMGADRAFT_1087698 [Armillaria gallica]